MDRRGTGQRPPDSVHAVERFFQLSVLGLLASGYLALAGSGRVEPLSLLVTAAALALRAGAAAGILRWQLPARWAHRLALASVVFAFVDWKLVSRDLLTAGIHLILSLTAIFVLAARTAREYGVLIALAFLELLGAASVSLDVNFFVFLVLFLLFGVATLTGAEIRRSLNASPASGPPPRRLSWRLAALSVWLTGAILVLTSALFFVLPRTAEAAFRRLAPWRFQLPGFAQEVRLGDIGRLLENPRPVLRARVLGSDAAGLHLKWRGVALSRFDGRRWYNPPGPRTVLPAQDRLLKLADSAPIQGGRRLSYEVMLDGSAADALFFAGVPELLWTSLPAVIREPNESLRPVTPVSGILRYGVHAFLPEEVAPGALPRRPVPSEVFECCLDLPALDPRIAALAHRLAEGFTSAHACTLAIERYLKENYGYTTRLPEQPPADPLAWFLFEGRRGHCEYFASAMAVLLRAVGIPSRVVTGFQGGVYNPVSGWHVLRASDAHAWVEAYLPAIGWTAFDPTPPSPRPQPLSPLAHLAFYLDATETFWQEWVLSYDLARQLVLASRMERTSRSLGTRWLEALAERSTSAVTRAKGLVRSRWPVLVAFVLLVALAVTLAVRTPQSWRVRRGLRRLGRGRGNPAEATLLYQRLLRVLERRGYRKPPWLTPAEFAAVLPESELARQVREFTLHYNRLRFGREFDAGPALVAILAALEKARPAKAS